MLLYLPVAEWPVNMFVIFGLGTAVGFISGMFGAGGGFLLTPLLVFPGISPAVAVASVSAQVVASSTSGALSYWRRRLVDWKLASHLLVGGMMGSAVGVAVFALLRKVGQLDLVIALCYVVLLGFVGAYTTAEAIGAVFAHRRGVVAAPAPRRQRAWIRALPFRVGYPRSQLEMSANPVGVLGTILGLKVLTPRIPGALIAVIGAIFISWKWDLSDHGVATLGPLPSALPNLGLPGVALSEVPALIGTAASIFVIILAAAEAAIALAIILNIYNPVQTVNVDEVSSLKE